VPEKEGVKRRWRRRRRRRRRRRQRRVRVERGTSSIEAEREGEEGLVVPRSMPEYL
jgi:hypothetical protein